MNQIVNMGGSAELANAGDETMGNSVVTAETYVQIATAKRFPRSLATFRRNIAAQASSDMSIARQCHYAIPRAGKTIEGPSIRFAEMVLQAWGNAHAGTRIVDELQHFIVAQGVFYDLENNVRVTEEVPRRIVDKDGARFNTDMIGVTGAAARSIALRNSILRGVPKAFWWDGYGAARLTIVGDIKTMKTRREEVLAWFKTHGIAEQQVFAALGVAGLVELGPDKLITLAGFRTSIEDEGKDPEHLFPPATTNAKRTAAPPPSPATPNPGDADAAAVPPTQATRPASPGPTPPTPESPPAPPPTSPGADLTSPGGAPPAANAPVETFNFADTMAAKQWTSEIRQRFEDLTSAAEVKALKETAEFKSRIDALYDLDEEAAVGVLALAQDLIDAFAAEVRK